MKKLQQGFTLVELLIVIVIIAILASITVVAYNGIQDKAKNAALLSAFDATEKALRIYAIQNGSYPQPTDIATPGTNYVCVGTGYQAIANFPNAGNGQPSCFLSSGSVVAASSSQFNTALQSVLGTQPNVSNIIASGLPSSYAFRGMMYWGWTAPNSDNPLGSAYLTYIVGGKTQQACGRGTPGFAGTYTECDLFLN